MADYIIQKAVNVEKVKRAHRLTLAEYGERFEAQHKYDGCCAVITLPDRGHAPVCQSRTGEVYPSLDGVAAELAHALRWEIAVHEGLVLIGEAWWPGKDQFAEISGEFRRLRPSDRLMFIVNDVLTTAEFEQGRSLCPYQYRLSRVTATLPDRVHWATRMPPGSYGCPQAFCNELVEMGGFDGLILRDPDGLWNRGNGTTGEIVKIKRVLSFDLEVIDMVDGKGKHEGRMGAIVVSFNGKRLSVGTGFTDAEREHQHYHGTWLGQIAEIEAMDLSSDGLLREPRFKGIRFDKLQADAA